ncbi:protein-glutamate O-methyltransferase CheR [Thiomicrorhabdus sp.]|uniref:CheR family methyltransferase n=1 Tax=Thiomicrorhabdus sp. TaxID=2039724 RepID=UPI0029C8C304|nr:protein-glutamate O-methyltransferase CheR [Thiomicrorhabdus sp.]
MNDKEFAFTDRDFSRVRKMVYDFAGINLNESKRNLVYNRLVKRIRFLNLPSFNDYLGYVERNPDEEFVHLINAITTNLTFFFRENHHFEYLANTVIPQLLIDKAQTRKIRIWSAGCSTGEEPYSLAMVLKENVPADWDAKVIATDLDTNVIETGRKGVYPLDRLKGVELARKRRWFLKGKGAQAGMVKARSELQSIIEFSQLNLMDSSWAIESQVDVIFCRNVVIYFDAPTQKRLFDRFADRLPMDGKLFVGHSESLHGISDRFSLLGKTVYQKSY